MKCVYALRLPIVPIHIQYTQRHKHERIFVCVCGWIWLILNDKIERASDRGMYEEEKERPQCGDIYWYRSQYEYPKHSDCN